MTISDSGYVLVKHGDGLSTAVSGVPITIGISYIEVIIGDHGNCLLGIIDNKVTDLNTYIGCNDKAYSIYTYDGNRYHNGRIDDPSAPGAKPNDKVGMLLDMDQRTMTFYKNGNIWGKGFQNMKLDSVVWTANMYYSGSKLTIVENATPPL